MGGVTWGQQKQESTLKKKKKKDVDQSFTDSSATRFPTPDSVSSQTWQEVSELQGHNGKKAFLQVGTKSMLTCIHSFSQVTWSN